jgi:glutathione S-transferase
MTITFYYGSGSPFSWKVWLALEHKQLPYDLKLLSLQQGEQKSPEYLALNPRGKVPLLLDDGCAIRDSAAIVEYLEERYPHHALLPRYLHERAVVRGIVAEANQYLYPATRRLLEQTLFRPEGGGDAAEIALAMKDVQHELSYIETALDGEYFARSLSLADITVYPMLALLKRFHEKQPQHQAGSLLAPKLAAFMAGIERLPYFAKTYPPHWKG